MELYLALCGILVKRKDKKNLVKNSYVDYVRIVFEAEPLAGT
jgi:hypothetical protein